MKDFCEAVLTIKVKADVAQVYKNAIETENSPIGLRTHWNGVYAMVGISIMEDDDPNDDVALQIQLLSHTAESLKQVVDWYGRVGCTVVRTDYKENKS